MTDIVRTSAVEAALVDGDLSRLSVPDRIAYYMRTCESLGLNPLTKPFAYLKLNGKLVLYPLRDCTDQLRKLNRVSITIASRETVGDCYIVTARATMPDGRCDESTGVVPLGKLNGENLANAYMKAETKAKRRATLSICGLGMVDDSEVDSIPGAQRVDVEAAHALPAHAVDVDGLVSALSTASGEVFEDLRAEAKALFRGLSAADKERVSDAVKAAMARLTQPTESESEGSCGDEGRDDV
jgi:hypothetical protein